MKLHKVKVQYKCILRRVEYSKRITSERQIDRQDNLTIVLPLSMLACRAKPYSQTHPQLVATFE